MARCPTCHRRLGPDRACPQHGGAPPEPRSGVSSSLPLAGPPAWSLPLGACVGRGGFAAVWEVSGAPGTVLKVAHADHELARARMRREAEALEAIGRPSVPRLQGSGVLDDGRAWLAMERIAGANLAELLALGPMPIRHAIALAAALLDALVRVHAAGFAHRDLKPDNLVRRTDGTIAILDLGLARKLPADPDDPTRAGVQVGSLEYIPPEQLLDAGSVDARADLYAFGCVLYELCAGRPPFLGDAAVLERAHAALRPPPLGALVQVPPALETLCHDCLAKQPARRPATAAEVAARLRDISSEPAQQLSQRSISVIREGKQPVVLLWAELPRVDRALLGVLAARKIAIASQRGRRVLGGVIGATHTDPVAAALAAARELSAAGARVALHLDGLAVRAAPSGVQLVGPAVDRPEDWLPAGPWTGVVLTKAIASVSRAPTREADLGAGFVKLGEDGEVTELFGRDALLADLTADAAAALGGAGPGLAVLLGDPGAGKTVVAAALAPRLAELGARVHVATVPPPGTGAPGHGALAALIGAPEGPIVRAVGDALRAAARAAPTAILLDDLHLADHELLDALEYATLGGEPLALWVLGIATPRLDARRPGFGARAERSSRAALAPLDEDAAVALTSALLRPAEYPPLRALRQIAGIARGNPMHLVALAREIRERGAIRARPSGEFFLDTTALDTLPTLALGPWLAARELAGLGDELAAFARLCAVLGGELARDELAAVLEAVERTGGAATPIDVDIGLAELEAAGILVRSGERRRFRQALLEEGVYQTTNEDERRALHAAALEYWLGRSAREPAVAARVARHAEVAGERRAAAAAYASLGEHAHERHRPLDADQAWQGAVRNLDEGTPLHARALLGRARARYRLQRQREAKADLEDVIAAARALGEGALEVEAMLELATVLDLTEHFDESSAVTEQARVRLGQLATQPPALVIDFALAEARGWFRSGALDRAIPQLREVISGARSLERWETATVAGLLLAPVLVMRGELDAAAAAFRELIELCTARDDRFHLAAALGNRATLWSARGESDRNEDDVRAAIQLTREGGQAHFERAATHNLAEDKLWSGGFDEALRLARRSLALQGHGEGSTRLDLLLVARIHAARGDRAELVGILGQIDGDQVGGPEAVLLRALRAIADDAPRPVWGEVLAESEHLETPFRLELALLAARAGQLDGPRREEARALAGGDPLFGRRASEF